MIQFHILLQLYKQVSAFLFVHVQTVCVHDLMAVRSQAVIVTMMKKMMMMFIPGSSSEGKQIGRVVTGVTSIGEKIEVRVSSSNRKWRESEVGPGSHTTGQQSKRDREREEERERVSERDRGNNGMSQWGEVEMLQQTDKEWTERRRKSEVAPRGGVFSSLDQESPGIVSFQ